MEKYEQILSEIAEFKKASNELKNHDASLSKMVNQLLSSINSLSSSIKEAKDSLTSSEANASTEALNRMNEQLAELISISNAKDELRARTYVDDDSANKIEQLLNSNAELQKELERLVAEERTLTDATQKELNQVRQGVIRGSKQANESALSSLTSGNANNKAYAEGYANQNLGTRLVNSRGNINQTTNSSGELIKDIEKSNKGMKEMTSTMKGLEEGFRYFMQYVKESWGIWKKVDDITVKYGRHIGLTEEQATAYRRNMLGQQADIVARYGMSLEQLTQIQEKYNDSTGRAVQLSNDQVRTVASISKFAGEEVTQEMMSNMDMYGVSAAKSAIELGHTYKDASAAGLNASKTSKDFANNVKMASKYTFNQGIEGVRKMTMLSEKFKFNLESMGAVAENFEDVDKAIENSAKLQMLGGNAGMEFSNPLEAMSMAQTDMEGLTEKVIDSFKGHAKWNSEKGMVDMSALDKRLLRERAKALGIDYEQAYNMATQPTKATEIDRHINAGTSKANQEWLENQAAYNNEKKQWEVTYYDENGQHTSKLEDLTNDQIEMARARSTAEDAMASDVADIDKMLRENFDKEARSYKSWEGIKTGGKTGGQMFLARAIDAVATSLKAIANFLFSSKWSALLTGLVGGTLFAGLKGMFVSATGKFLRNSTQALLRGGKPSMPFANTRQRISNWWKGRGSVPTNGGAVPKGSRPDGLWKDSAGKWRDAKGRFAKAPVNAATNASEGVNATRSGSIWSRMTSKVRGVGGNAMTKAKAVATGAKNMMQGSKLASVAGKTANVLSKASPALKMAGKALGPIGAAITVGTSVYGLATRGKETKAKMDAIDANADYGDFRKRYEKKMIEEEAGRKNAADVTKIAATAIGATIGSIIPGLGTMAGAGVGALVGEAAGFAIEKSHDIKNFLFGKSEEESMTDADWKQKDFERSKMGANVDKMSSDDIKIAAARATIGIHDLLISKMNKEEGLQENGEEKDKGIIGKIGSFFGFAKGGVVEEPKNPVKTNSTDTVLATLTPGESVLTTAQTQAIQALAKSLGVDEKTATEMVTNSTSIEDQYAKAQKQDSWFGMPSTLGDIMKYTGIGGMIFDKIAPEALKNTSISPVEIGKGIFEKVKAPLEGITNAFGIDSPSTKNININGTIDLKSNGKSASIDIHELIKDTNFKKQLMEMVISELNIKNNSGQGKNKNSRWGVMSNQLSPKSIK